MSTFGLTWNLKSPDRNKQFILNILRNIITTKIIMEYTFCKFDFTRAQLMWAIHRSITVIFFRCSNFKKFYIRPRRWIFWSCTYACHFYKDVLKIDDKNNQETQVQLFNYRKADDKILVCKFSKMVSPSYIILGIQRLESKLCRSRWGG